MKFDHPIFYKLAALLGSTAVRAWMDTLDYRVVFYDPDVDPASTALPRPEDLCLLARVHPFPIGDAGALQPGDAA